MPVKVKKRPKNLVRANKADPDTLYEIIECKHSDMVGCVAEMILGYNFEAEGLVTSQDHFVVMGSDMAVYRDSDSWRSLVLRPVNPGDILIVVD